MSLLKRIGQGQGAPAPPPGGPAPAASPAGGEDQASKLAECRRRTTTLPGSGGAPGGGGGVGDIKKRVQDRLMSEIPPNMDMTRTAEVRKMIEDLYESILAEEGLVLNRAERSRLFDAIVSEILGFGPVGFLLREG